MGAGIIPYLQFLQRARALEDRNAQTQAIIDSRADRLRTQAGIAGINQALEPLQEQQKVRRTLSTQQKWRLQQLENSEAALDARNDLHPETKKRLKFEILKEKLGINQRPARIEEPVDPNELFQPVPHLTNAVFNTKTGEVIHDRNVPKAGAAATKPGKDPRMEFIKKHVEKNLPLQMMLAGGEEGEEGATAESQQEIAERVAREGSALYDILQRVSTGQASAEDEEAEAAAKEVIEEIMPKAPAARRPFFAQEPGEGAGPLPDVLTLADSAPRGELAARPARPRTTRLEEPERSRAPRTQRAPQPQTGPAQPQPEPATPAAREFSPRMSINESQDFLREAEKLPGGFYGMPESVRDTFIMRAAWPTSRVPPPSKRKDKMLTVHPRTGALIAWDAEQGDWEEVQ